MNKTPNGLTNTKVKQYQDLIIQMNDEQLIMIGMKEIVQSAINRGMFEKLSMAIKEVSK